METMSPGGPSTALLRRPRARVSLWSLRALVTAHLLAVLAQPVLAGLVLTGDGPAAAWHRITGGAVVLLAMAVAVASFAHAVTGREGWSVFPMACAIALLETVQLGLGFSGVLAAHVPLGVVVTTGAVLLAGRVWSSSARRPR